MSSAGSLTTSNGTDSFAEAGAAADDDDNAAVVVVVVVVVVVAAAAAAAAASPGFFSSSAAGSIASNDDDDTAADAGFRGLDEGVVDDDIADSRFFLSRAIMSSRDSFAPEDVDADADAGDGDGAAAVAGDWAGVASAALPVAALALAADGLRGVNGPKISSAVTHSLRSGFGELNGDVAGAAAAAAAEAEAAAAPSLKRGGVLAGTEMLLLLLCSEARAEPVWLRRGGVDGGC